MPPTHTDEGIRAAGRIRRQYPRTALRVLSQREREVLALMAEGLTDRGFAERLTASPKTVGTHVRRIFDRLEIADSPRDNRRVRAVLSYLRAR